MANETDNQNHDPLEKLLPSALAAAPVSSEAHYELDDLTHLADARREHGDSWDMPPHLSRCSLCLELFQIILEGVSKPSAQTLQRFTDLRTTASPADPKIVPFTSRAKPLLQIAAAIAVLLTGFLLFRHFNPPTSAHVDAGHFTLPGGQTLAQGAPVPDGVTVTATEATTATLNDGSKLDLARNTQVSFQHSFGGNTTIALATGELTASVTKQKAGHDFIVKTPLGSVLVVGTKFTVTSHSENVVVYQSIAGQTNAQQRIGVVLATHVNVLEGVVRVRRSGVQVTLTAHQFAVIRESEPGIEVLQETH